MTTTKTAIPTLKATALLPLLALTACAGSQRFSGPVMNPPSYSQPVLPAAPPVASAPVTSEPLPPPGGYPAASAPAPAPGAPGQDPFFESGGVPPGQGQPPMGQPGSAPTAPGNNQVAGLGPSPAAPARPSATRDNVIGGWTAREATGGTCRIQLSSAPTLDLYRASSSGCANRDLQKITAWDYRDGEVYLYQQGGTVAARLRATSGNALDGAVTKSGAALSLNR
ncbi:AprI/Inh family metalloprotease inhibitor [Bosea minatitlanensis]|uniref:AprI/Inh family metalloprotease inhibitor n=1 Tax=Bosea minatitlanensis TaxID=128782 RepID=A0ABW0F2R6_9HYPH|nr:AprI/Inh family metalloprotease inhibitor [Bosea minatitlanensis]MCT4496084.1 protease inhibitor Inh/omp19 family protein [Bosea minatitlanensis]